MSIREVSAIDAKILKDLLKDGRKNFTEIAKECGETKSTIWKRYTKMKKAGIITGATIQLNYTSFGYDAVGIIQFNTEPRLVDHAVEYCKKNTQYSQRLAIWKKFQYNCGGNTGKHR